MSIKLLSFESFAKDCDYQNKRNDTYAECLHDENKNDNCIECCCPLVRLASLADVRELDPDNYEQQASSFVEELLTGWDEDNLFPCDKGDDLVVWVFLDKDL